MDNQRKARLELMIKEAGLSANIIRRLGGKKALKGAMKRFGFDDFISEAKLTREQSARVKAWKEGRDAAASTARARKHAIREGVDLDYKSPSRAYTHARLARKEVARGREAKDRFRKLKALEESNKKWSPM